MILMLVLKYDRRHISPGNPVCLYSKNLTFSSEHEVLMCSYVTHSRMHSQMYITNFLPGKYTGNFKIYDPYVA